MTAEQTRQGRRVVTLAILVTVALLFLAIAAVGPQMAGDIAAEYGRRVYQPERAEYCPGEVLRASYTVQPVSQGQVEIMGSWRNVDQRTTLLSETTRQWANIWEAAPVPITATLSVTIPLSPQMIPGSSWMYIRSVRKLGQTDVDMFAVPFVIRAGCRLHNANQRRLRWLACGPMLCRTIVLACPGRIQDSGRSRLRLGGREAASSVKGFCKLIS